MSLYAVAGFAEGLERATNTLLQIQMFKQKMAHEDKHQELQQEHMDAQYKYLNAALEVRAAQGDINASIKLDDLKEKKKMDDLKADAIQTGTKIKKFGLNAIEEQAKQDAAALHAQLQGQPQVGQQGQQPPPVAGFSAGGLPQPQQQPRWIYGANGPRQQPTSGITEAQDQRTWNHVVDKTDALLQSSRSGVGMAVNANIRANRALTLLNKKDMTPQDMDIVSTDFAAIFKGGVPDQIGSHEQQYNTIQKQWAGLVQYVTANPQNANSPEIKKKMISLSNDLKKLDTNILDDHFKYMEAAYKPVIAKHKDEWQGMKDSMYGSSVMQTGDEKHGGKELTKDNLFEGL